MKRVSDERIVWLCRTRWLRERNRLHHKKIAKLKRKGELRLRANFYLGSGRTRKGWVSARGNALPRDFCLDSNYNEVTKFLEKFRETAHSDLDLWIKSGRPKKHKKRVSRWLDFSTIENITPSAALVFTSEFDRLRRLSGNRMFAIDVDRWKPDVAVVFDRLGLFELLEIDNEDKENFYKSAKSNLFILPIRSGEKVVGAEAYELNKDLATIAIETAKSSIVSDFEFDNMNKEERWLERAEGIYNILVEAMDNVINHAYPKDMHFSLRTVRRWWMTAAIDKVERKLTVAIFDQGVSIPVSLPHWRRYGRFKKVLRRILGIDHDSSNIAQDGEAIRLATRVAASSTRLPHRGKGLGFMQEFIDECRGGRLRIISRCGEYRYTKGEAPIVMSHPVTIGGTLIEWELRL